MKNFTLLLVSLFSLSTVYAQHSSAITERSAITSRSVNPIYDSVRRWLFDRTTKKWDNQERQINFTYNSYNKNTGFIQQVWNDTFQNWQNSVKETYTYTASDSLSSETILFWTDTGWLNSLQWLYTYDGNNNLVTETLQTWDTTKWVNNYEQIRGFNSKNLDTSILIRGSNGTVWDTSEQFIYTYNAANLDTGELTQLWKSSAWSNSSRISYKYTGTNVDTQYTYSASGSLWAYSSLYTFTYNGDNLNTSFTDYEYSSGWVPITRYLYSYNAENFDTGTITQLWSGSTWALLANETDAYYPNGVEQWASYHSYSTTADTIISGDSTYWYINGSAGINQLSSATNQLTLYPNPSTGLVTITSTKNINDITVTNLVGQTVLKSLSEDLGVNQTIDLSNLPGGIYFITVTNKMGREVAKVVKE